MVWSKAFNYFCIILQVLFNIYLQRGKRVPVLIPNDTSKALTYITDKEVRKIGGVKSTNQYMFATKGMYITKANIKK